MATLISVNHTAFFIGMLLSVVLVAGIVLVAFKKADSLTSK